MKPKHKNKKFTNEQEFEKWLKENTVFEIEFEDNGQDFLKWYIDKHGEVLHSDLQNFVWNGKMIDMFKSRVSKFLVFQNGEKFKHKIKNITNTQL